MYLFNFLIVHIPTWTLAFFFAMLSLLPPVTSPNKPLVTTSRWFSHKDCSDVVFAKNYPGMACKTLQQSVVRNNNTLPDWFWSYLFLFDAWHLEEIYFYRPSEFFLLIPSSSVKRTAVALRVKQTAINRFVYKSVCNSDTSTLLLALIEVFFFFFMLFIYKHTGNVKKWFWIITVKNVEAELILLKFQHFLKCRLWLHSKKTGANWRTRSLKVLQRQLPDCVFPYFVGQLLGSAAALPCEDRWIQVSKAVFIFRRSFSVVCFVCSFSLSLSLPPPALKLPVQRSSFSHLSGSLYPGVWTKTLFWGLCYVSVWFPGAHRPCRDRKRC